MNNTFFWFDFVDSISDNKNDDDHDYNDAFSVFFLKIKKMSFFHFTCEHQFTYFAFFGFRGSSGSSSKPMLKSSPKSRGTNGVRIFMCVGLVCEPYPSAFNCNVWQIHQFDIFYFLNRIEKTFNSIQLHEQNLVLFPFFLTYFEHSHFMDFKSECHSKLIVTQIS